MLLTELGQLEQAFQAYERARTRPPVFSPVIWPRRRASKATRPWSGSDWVRTSGYCAGRRVASCLRRPRARVRAGRGQVDPRAAPGRPGTLQSRARSGQLAAPHVPGAGTVERRRLRRSCRGVLLARAEPTGGAVDLAAVVASEFEAVGSEINKAGTLLLRGQGLRRLARYADALEELGRSRAIFAGSDCAGWVAHVRRRIANREVQVPVLAMDRDVDRAVGPIILDGIVQQVVQNLTEFVGSVTREVLSSAFNWTRSPCTRPGGGPPRRTGGPPHSHRRSGNAAGRSPRPAVRVPGAARLPGGSVGRWCGSPPGRPGTPPTSGLRKVTSSVVIRAARGVRNSCEMSAVACFSLANALLSSSRVVVNRSTIGDNSRGSRFWSKCRLKSRSLTLLTASPSRWSGDSPRRTSQNTPEQYRPNTQAVDHRARPNPVAERASPPSCWSGFPGHCSSRPSGLPGRRRADSYGVLDAQGGPGPHLTTGRVIPRRVLPRAPTPVLAPTPARRPTQGNKAGSSSSVTRASTVSPSSTSSKPTSMTGPLGANTPGSNAKVRLRRDGERYFAPHALLI